MIIPMITDLVNAVRNQLPLPSAEIPLPPPPAEGAYIPTPEDLADWREIELQISQTMR